MKPFITKILQDLLKTEEDISKVIFVLPSKRAGSFLLNEMAKLSSTNIFAPAVYSIEEFTEEISGLNTIDNTISLFEFYDVYKNLTPAESREDFEIFITWAQSLIHDFNEIDRYLVDHKSFFDYLSNIQDINHWYLQEQKTDLIKKYLLFWNKLPEYYSSLKSRLLSQKKAYQGLIYRQAAAKIKDYTPATKSKHVFIGFNALNTAEQEILQYMLQTGRAEVHWDIDEVFLRDREHQASSFIRKYLEEWPYYKSNKIPAGKEYAKEKEITITGIPKNIGQAKYLGNLLAKLDQKELQKTAVVLGEEDLLLPVLNSLPPGVNQLNITMGFPLKNAPVNSLFEKLFRIQESSTNEHYYKDVIEIINHPALHANLQPHSTYLIQKIHKENVVYLKAADIKQYFPDHLHPLLDSCFISWNDKPATALDHFQLIIQRIKENLRKGPVALELEFLYQFHLLFNKLENLNNAYPHISSIKSLHHFYKEIMSSQTLDFHGRPFKGLQLMGMLESRALDFENVIITSVNEGILPSGKSDNSFIPYDLKKAYNLPTYKEKDAVYTYHFYRLLQRAKKVNLIYNTESSGLNAGEKSRFITQLEIEQQPAHKLRHNLISPRVPPVGKKLKEVQKTPEMLHKIRNLAESGFSPSALTTYIRNPLDFYYRYVLGVKDQEEVEETVAHNTLGTVIHDSLQAFYEPLEGRTLSENDVLNFIEKVPGEISRQFQKTYTRAPMNKGKNLLIFEVAKRYLNNFLKQELKRLKKGDEIKILHIEKDLKAKVPMETLEFPVYIRGKVDRVENTNGITRIIDYKTGKVLKNQVEIVDWENIASDYDKCSKSFQVLTYTSMMNYTEEFKQPVEAGIISFKNLKQNFLKFAKKDKKGQRSGKTLIDDEVLEAFQEELKNLIAEICDPKIAFTEKEIKKTYGN